MKQNVHDNSIATYEQERQRLGARAQKILEFLQHNSQSTFTDKQVANHLDFDHVSKVN